MKKIYVLDSGVIAKWFNEEEYSKVAIRFRDLYINGLIELKEPPILPFEVANTINRNLQLSLEDALKAAGSLCTLAHNAIELPCEDDMKSIMQIARQLDITFYDAVYVFLAKKYDAIFITVDDELYEKARKIVKTSHLADALELISSIK
ncbi:MAG: type II toxin-antitoxin system VapC family toxin [Thermoprotei archaeon]